MSRGKGVLERAGLPVELTSLLDVIFLILFVVMQSKQLSVMELQNKSEAQAAAMEAELEATRAELEETKAELGRVTTELEETKKLLSSTQTDLTVIERNYEQRIDAYEHFDMYAAIVTVYITYDPENVKERAIRISGPNLEPDPIHFDSSNEMAAWNRMKKYLTAYAQGKEESGIPVILSVNGDGILHRDELRAETIFNGLRRDFGNVYVK